MRIDHDSFFLPKCVSQHNIGGFSPDPWERGQFFQRIGDRTLMFRNDRGSSSTDTLRLASEKARGANEPLEHCWRSFGVVPRRSVLCKESWGNEIDALICALSGQDRRDK